ncbi:MAG TPA: hypothetical protein VGI10_22420 [Polyangiaceae bacterium]
MNSKFVSVIEVGVVSALVLAASTASAAPKDKAATKLADAAMQQDYVGTQFKKAEQKLKKAIQTCGDDGCSPVVMGRLHRDLATVYIGGLNQPAKGKPEMKAAIEAYPDLQLDKDLETPELRKAYEAAGGGKKAKADDDEDEKPKKKAKKDEDEDEKPADEDKGDEDKKAKKDDDEDEEKPAEKEEDSGSSDGPLNWLSLTVQQDFMVYPGESDVCVNSAQYTCFQSGVQANAVALGDDGSGTNNYIHATGTSGGDQVKSGIGLATTRILLGFDRFVIPSLTIGARVGFAIGGAPKPDVGSSFLPVHAEVRAAYWFSKGSIRPYVLLGGGLAEVDSHVAVDYFQTDDVSGATCGTKGCQKGTLDAYRHSGNGFVSLGFGTLFMVGKTFGIGPELRFMQMLGKGGTTLSAALGGHYGF